MKKHIDSALTTSTEYRRFIEDLKARVISARICAARAVNRDLILLYWDIGLGIVEKQKTLGWGDAVVEMVAADLRRAFPASQSFSPDNLWRMRQFYLAYSSSEFLGQATGPAIAFHGQSPILDLLAAVPWGQNLLILKKTTDPAARLYYLRVTARFGWSRNVLLNQIKAGAYERAVKEKKAHNFELALPENLAEQADEILKSSYNLEFLGLRQAVRERELEDQLISRLQAFLLELGYGFCFVGRQHRLALAQKEYFMPSGPSRTRLASRSTGCNPSSRPT